MAELDPQLRRIVTGYTEQAQAPAEVRQRIWSDLQAARAGATPRIPALADEFDAFEEAPPARRRVLAVGILVAALVPLALATNWWIDASSLSTDRNDNMAAVHQAAPTSYGGSGQVITPQRHAAAASPASESESATPETTERASSRARKSTADRRRSRSRSKAATGLAREMELLHQARQSLRQGDETAALHRLAVHKREFPKGELSDERVLLRVRALCDQGQLHKVRQEIGEHAKRAIFRERLRATCPSAR